MNKEPQNFNLQDNHVALLKQTLENKNCYLASEEDKEFNVLLDLCRNDLTARRKASRKEILEKGKDCYAFHAKALGILNRLVKISNAKLPTSITKETESPQVQEICSMIQHWHDILEGKPEKSSFSVFHNIKEVTSSMDKFMDSLVGGDSFTQ